MLRFDIAYLKACSVTLFPPGSFLRYMLYGSADILLFSPIQLNLAALHMHQLWRMLSLLERSRT